MLDSRVAGKLSYRAAVTRTDNENFLYIGINSHRHSRYHFVVYILVLFGKHYKPVKHQHSAKFICVKNINILIIALAGI